jgi:hypothetical protein
MVNQTKITYNGQEFMVNFPNVGQLMEIESMKMILANGKYSELVNNSTKSSIFVLDLIDAFATFSTLIPDLKAQLPTKGYTTMDPKEAKELVKVFKEQFFGWFNEIMKDIYKDV